MSSLYLRLWASFIGALILSILPMPELISTFRPPWVFLLILYIEYFLPNTFRLSTLLIIGLFLDILLSTTIGEHSFALLMITWIASSKSRRFKFFPMIQQILFIGLFCFLYQIIISCIDAVSGFHFNWLMPFVSALLSIMAWPWIRLFADASLLKRRR